MDLKKGIILKLTGGNYYTKVSNIIIKCRARGLFRHQNIKPVVGDNVMVEMLENNEGYIIEVLERKNSLVRPPIANIDQALIVISYKEPDYSLNLLDKLLAIIEFLNIKPIIIVSKADLATSITEIEEVFSIYTNANYDVIITSIVSEINLVEIKELFKDKVSVLIGQSGAGKSSILNMLEPEYNLETNEISKALNRGKHTTRHVEIFETKYGMIADSPGFSSLDLELMDAQDLACSYHDFNEAAKQCKFSNCLHENEPSCHVKELVENGTIAKSRYDNYLTFLKEIKDRKVRY